MVGASWCYNYFMTHKHTPISNSDIVRITNLVEGTAFQNYADLYTVLEPARARLLQQWQKSLDADGGPSHPDFSVYHDSEYNYEGIHCFEKSKTCTGNMIKYFHRLKLGNVYRGWHIGLSDPRGILYNGKPPSEMSVLDVYNGNGLTTAHLLINGFNVESFNDCDPQIAYMQAACKDLAGKTVKNHKTLPTKQFDIVVSLEVLEHYTDPLVHARDLVRLTAPGGYLVESSGFNGSSENIGHFDTYEIDGERMNYREARRKTSDFLAFYFEKVFIGFGKMPRIWKLKDTPGKTPKPEPIDPPSTFYVKKRGEA